MVKEHDTRRLVATFEGPAVQYGRVSVPDFVRVLDGLQRALLITGQRLMGRARAPGPIPQTYIQQLTLDLVATSPGSFTATLELPEADNGLIDFGQSALDTLIQGLDEELSGNPGALPRDALSVIQETILKAIPTESQLVIRGGTRQQRVVLQPDAAMVFHALEVESAPAPRQRKRIVGRLLEIDFKDRTAEIWDSSNRMTKVTFDESLSDSLKASARLQVVVEGNEEIDSHGRVRRLQLAEVSPLDLPDVDFWRNPTIEDLVREQGIRPIESISDLVAESFFDEDPAEIISELSNLKTISG